MTRREPFAAFPAWRRSNVEASGPLDTGDARLVLGSVLVEEKRYGGEPSLFFAGSSGDRP